MINIAKYLAIAAVSLSGLAASPLVAQQVSIDPNTLRALAVEALNAGDSALALRLSSALIKRDPKDAVALINAARATYAMGDFESSVTFARRAYFATSNRDVLFVAARAAANANAKQEKDTFAQLWLRRARQYAPNDELSQSVARDYQFLSRRSPWSTSLSFGIAPNSNINGGSIAENIFGFLTLDEEGKGFSGLEYNAGLTTSYRLSANNTSASFATFDLNYRTYSLSSTSKERIEAENDANRATLDANNVRSQANVDALNAINLANAPDPALFVPAVFVPDVFEPNVYRGSDYSTGSIGFGFNHRRILAEDMLPASFGVRFGQNWYAGEPDFRTISLTAAQPFALSDDTDLRVSAALNRQTSLDGDDPIKTFRLTADWSHTFDNGDRLAIGYGRTNSSSDDVRSDYVGNRVSLGYDFGRAFDGFKFGVSVTVDQKNFSGSQFALPNMADRSDKTVTARLSAQLTDLEIYGFQPILTIEKSQNRSNSDLYDRDFFDFGVDLQSSF